MTIRNAQSRQSIWAIMFGLVWVQLVPAVELYTLSTIPTSLSSDCQAALLADVADCNLMVTKFRYGYFYPQALLEKTCTLPCGTALKAFEDAVVAACAGDVWDGYRDDGEADMPVAVIPNVLRYLYEMTCLQDEERFCNVVAGANAALADPGDGVSGWLGTVDNTTAAAEACDMCFIKSLRMQAGSSYYDGPALASSSIYESKTSSCQVSDMPRTTSTLPFTVPAPAEPTSMTCAGKIYDIQAGDDCHSVSISQGIGTAWLLSDNNLAAFCTDFPSSGSLCLVNTCSVYTVQANDTCKGIARSANITEAALKSWNPAINSGCSNLDRLVNDQVCIGVPGIAYIDPEPTVLAPTIATTSAPIPTDVAPGVVTNCGKYYQVQPDEYCNLIVLRFGLTLADFTLLNPDINENCTNLYAYESYCVLPVGDINTYPGRPGASATTTPTATIPFTPITSLDPVATSSAPIYVSTELPLAVGTREDCARYFDGAQVLDEDISGTSYANACEFAAAVWAVSLDEFSRWNSALGNLTAGECDMAAELRYCAKLRYADALPSYEGVGYEFEIRAGSIETCTQYADAWPDWDCSDILLNYELTIAQFYEYNPVVGADCSGLWPEYAYCIRAADYVSPVTSTTTASATTTATSRTTTTGPPAATHTGQPANCDEWHVVVDDDTCTSIEQAYSITAPQFLAWNPAVSADCSTNFWLGYAYCVGVSDDTPTVTTTRTTAAPTTTPSVPSPVQEGNAVSNCVAYGQAADGDWCSAFADLNGITLAELYAWNTLLGSTGENCGSSFWAGYWYCIGVA
ncbi:uncharacterized protein BCR38DRAFT_431162 [Pseudomassariella vexata]|uniref:LysM domain-containing protein n=1 Tax=Pseudomassariella vexata TaxID=1141098 RepID=A0A1Y2E1V9_9PEZI|nr:uncharacterized protein BCR38DRAFT_431162 [Pseudomassariella vexata]ORY64855.1 hypothetical protein BCR38DRAFT_431162 [Pseudomassariella vexata]